MKFCWKNYYTTLTPKKLKKAADCLLAACSTASSFAMINTYVKTGLAILVLGVVAKFFSDWFKTDDQ